MTAIPDGAPLPGDGDRLAAGWLAAAGFPRGPVGEPYRHRLFCERLFEACRNWSVNPMRGFHTCPFCPPGEDDDALMRRVDRNGRRALLGNAEIRAVDPAGGRWAAPNLVYHYVVDHNYRPPAGFVDAVLTGTLQAPEPPSIGSFHWGPDVGLLETLDPDLHGQVRAELPDAEVQVAEAERFEAPGVWRPVFRWRIKPGHHVVTYDGTDSWRDELRAAAAGAGGRDR